MRCVEVNLVLVLAVTISIIQAADCWHRWHGRRHGGRWNQRHHQDMSMHRNHPFGFRHDPAWYTRHSWVNSSPYIQHGQWPMRHYGYGRWRHNWNTLETSTQAVTVPDRLIAGPQIPMLTGNPLLQTTVKPFSTSRPTFATASATSTVSHKLRPQLRFGGDVIPRDVANEDWDDYDNEMKEKFDDKSDFN